jgi:endonuclease YncB( thermonuclease family)
MAAILPLLLVLGALQAPSAPQLDSTGLTPVKVVDCPDGGRLRVNIDGSEATVHLLGVTATDPQDRQPLLAQNGTASQQLLSSLAVGEQVYLDPDRPRRRGEIGPRWPEADRNGVLQAHVWRVRDGLLLNAELLKQGVVFYASSDQPRDAYLQYYSWCQRQADDAHLGLWSGKQLVAAGLPDTPARAVPPSEGAMPGINLPGTAPPPAAPEEPLEFTGGADAAAELPGDLSVESASARIVRHGKGSSDFSWVVSLNNEGRRRLKVNVTLRFLDEDGYVLGDATQRGVTVPARGDREVKGTRRLEADPASRVAAVSVLVKLAR